MARLRDRRFFSLAELNAAIRELVGDLNARLMRKLGASRREFFERIDRPALLSLPAAPHEYAEWRPARVAPDHPVAVHARQRAVKGKRVSVRVYPGGRRFI